MSTPVIDNSGKAQPVQEAPLATAAPRLAMDLVSFRDNNMSTPERGDA
jgi:hypothetical protein